MTTSGRGIGLQGSVLQAGTGAVLETIEAKERQIVSVKDFGAVGDGVTDDTTAIQNAWNQVATTGGRLYFPAGTYAISSAISIANTFFGGSIEGESWSCVTIKATSVMTAIFTFTDAGTNSRFAFKEITLDGNSLADSGIYSHLFRNGHLERVLIKGTLVAGVDLAEGWDNDFISCEFSSNAGDGMRLGSNVNNVNVFGTKVLLNTGWGIRITRGPGPINITGSDIEYNNKGGIYLAAGSGTANNGVLNIKNNYFEGNAGYSFSATTTSGQPTITASAAAVAIANANVGHAYYGDSIPANSTISSASGTTITINNNATASTTETEYIAVGDTLSATAVYTDILLNGSNDFTTLAETLPIQSVNIEGNLLTSRASTSLVGYVAAQSVRFIGNVRTTFSSRTVTLLGLLLNPTYPQGSVTFKDNEGFTAYNGPGPDIHQRAALLAPNGGSVTIDLGLGSEFVVTPSTATAFTISNPTNRLGSASRFQYQRFTIRIRNTTGGALGAITWDTLYKMAAWASPATGFSRTISFTWDAAATAWVEEHRTSADIPN